MTYWKQRENEAKRKKKILIHADLRIWWHYYWTFVFQVCCKKKRDIWKWSPSKSPEKYYNPSDIRDGFNNTEVCSVSNSSSDVFANPIFNMGASVVFISDNLCAAHQDTDTNHFLPFLLFQPQGPLKQLHPLFWKLSLLYRKFEDIEFCSKENETRVSKDPKHLWFSLLEVKNKSN